MKFSTKNAVSGIQGQMNDNVRNRTMESVIKGLATGGYGVAKQNQAQSQVEKLQKALMGQDSLYDEMANDPSSSKAEKLFANMKKQQLGLMASGLTPNNVNDIYTQLMKPDMSLFNYQAGIDKANIQASAYGAKNAEKAAREAKLDEFLNNAVEGNSGGFSFNLGGLLDPFGMGGGASGAVGNFNFGG